MHSCILCISVCICLYLDPTYMQMYTSVPEYMRICTPAFSAYPYVSVCILVLQTSTHAFVHQIRFFMQGRRPRRRQSSSAAGGAGGTGGGRVGSARATPAPEPSLGLASHVKLERLVACLLQTFEGCCVLVIANAGNPAVVGPEVRSEKMRKSGS